MNPKKSALKKKENQKEANLSETSNNGSNQKRHEMIEYAAYFLAEEKNFSSDPVENWLDAEQEIDSALSESNTSE